MTEVRWLFWILFLGVIVQRLAELLVAARNGRVLRNEGGYEVGGDHYKYLVMLHLFFFVSWWAEVVIVQPVVPEWWWLPLGMFILAQFVRGWVMYTLGPYWNTRIYVVPGMNLVKKGPYRWMRHPNYIVVIVEMITLPLIFGAWFTAVVPALLNLIFLLKVRIPVEEQALQEALHSTMPSSTRSAK